MTSEKKAKLKTSLRVKILIVFTMIILLVMMFPKGEAIESEVTVGSIWIQDDLIASQTFEILKNPETYEREKQIAAESVQPIFLKDTELPKKILDSLKNYNQFLIRLLDENIKTGDSKVGESFLSKESYDYFLQMRRREINLVSRSRRSLTEILKYASDLVDRIYQRGLLSRAYNEIYRDSISLREGRFERVVPKRIFLDRTSVNDFVDLYLRNSYGTDNALNNALTEYLDHFFTPNIIFSSTLTEDAIKNAKDKVSRNVGIVNENERIVSKHDRITPETKLKIDSYRIAKGEEMGFWGRFAQNFGKFLHIILVLLLYSMYIYLFRKKIYKDNAKILLIAIIITFVSFTTFLIHHMNVNTPVEFLVIVPVASMLLTIIFDSRVGFYGTVVTALICGGLRGNDYVFAMMNITAGALAAYTVRDIKNRTQIFRSFVFILLGYVLSIVAFGLERFDSVEKMLISSAFAASNALISPVFTYGLIIFIERIFNITTDLTLLELTDFNRPLLKELARNAPGTFNHSMTIGTLVETAAEAIGANPILARVGAYYHDIGKTFEPGSFVENQMSNKNIHEDLPPEKSVELIKSHVTKGIELARSQGLPSEITDFIPMHHGTMVISFFYEKAKKLYGEDKVNIADYRYSGPKPNTRETALVMLADACESTVRAMSEPDPQKVENVINNLINSRVDDGQLDNSPLTFSDIKKIKEAFQSILIGQHHKRIRYPQQEILENSSDNN